MKQQLALLLLLASPAAAASALGEQQQQQGDCQGGFLASCGYELERLSGAVESGCVMGMVKWSAGVAQCGMGLASTGGDSDDKCKPLGEDVKFILAATATHPSQEEKNLGDACSDIVETMCGAEMRKLEELLAAKASPQDITRGSRDLIKCLIDHDDVIGPKCNVRVSLTAESKESKCRKELYTRCGQPLDDLTGALEEENILAIVSSAVESASCVTENLKVMTLVCSAEEEKESSSSVTTVTVKEEKSAMRMTAIALGESESRCHDAFEEECGDKMDSLRKAIDDVSLTGIVGSSLELAGCITSNFVRLVEACSPFKKSQDAIMEFTDSFDSSSDSESNDDDDDMSSMMESSSSVGGSSFVKAIKSYHFDFHKCVEVAKHVLLYEYFKHHHGDHHHHHHHDDHHHHHHHHPGHEEDDHHHHHSGSKDDDHHHSDHGHDDEHHHHDEHHHDDHHHDEHHSEHHWWDHHHWDHHSSHHHPCEHPEHHHHFMLLLAAASLFTVGFSFYKGYRIGRFRRERQQTQEPITGKIVDEKSYIPLSGEQAAESA